MECTGPPHEALWQTRTACWPESTSVGCKYRLPRLYAVCLRNKTASCCDTQTGDMDSCCNSLLYGHQCHTETKPAGIEPLSQGRPGRCWPTSQQHTRDPWAGTHQSGPNDGLCLPPGGSRTNRPSGRLCLGRYTTRQSHVL